MTTIARWRKSTYTAQEANCVELAHTGDMVRDSKNRTGPVLHGNAAALVAAVKAGHIGR